ncbi:MAG: ABC transporter transmembrane domain-containing protein, partial [Bilophila sp.]
MYTQDTASVDHDAETRLAPAELDRIPPTIHSLVTLLRLLGKTVSPNFLMGGGVGVNSSPATCLRAAQRAGLFGKIVQQEDLRTLSPLTLPCILLLRAHHTCVLLHIEDTQATIILSEHGEQVSTVPLEELHAMYLGYVLFAALQASDTALQERFRHIPRTRHKRWFWDVLLYYWPLYRHVAVASIAINAIGVTGSLFAMNVYDRVVPNNALETLWVLATGVLLAYFCDFILRNVRNYFVDVAGRNADVVLSSKLVEKVLTMRFDKKPESTGAMVNNLREFEALRDFFSSGTLLTFVDLPFLLLFLLLTWYIGGP